MAKIVRIPDGVDAPPQLLLWEADEMAPVIAGLIAGVALDRLLICLTIGLLLIKVYRQVRDRRPDGFFLHWLYWYGFGATKGYSLINPFARRWTN